MVETLSAVAATFPARSEPAVGLSLGLVCFQAQRWFALPGQSLLGQTGELAEVRVVEKGA